MHSKRKNDNMPAVPDKHELFFQLYGSCQNKLYGFLYMMLHNDSDAEDVLQETVVALWENFDKFEEGSNFTAWAMVIAKNKALNYLKTNSRSRVMLRSEFYSRVAEYIDNDNDDYSDRTVAMRECVRKLGNTDQNILKMKYDSNIAINKIAESMGRSKKGIYNTMARIHNVLNECIRRKLATMQR
ncbi:MAG: sigma-70 family RNA polymerase sigma factor [Sedimentisphaerales bacterium]|nr:sigma-70 family RNA polymerase sigma factor [Sedimentisphaerales bacterium]